ncbi:MAG: hypothetical protein P9L99_19595 [Candidatus Lernaella stagnicola]|nr:hypothetical protein [Candidatus Lernaella stagnicola]
MKSLNWLAVLLALCLFASVAVVACDDDDDDDDNNDDDSAGDDDDGFGDGMDRCISLQMECFGFDQSAALLVCEEYYNLEQPCSKGATEIFLNCVGTDCSNWDACATAWEDAINC